MPTPNDSSQLNAFLDNAERKGLKPDPKAGDQTQTVPTSNGKREVPGARVPFRSGLILSDEQQERLVEHCLQSISTISKEMGRDQLNLDGSGGGNAGAGVTASNGQTASSVQEMMFLPKRRTFDLLYQNRVEWRKSVLGGIFRQSNIVVPLARRIVRQMAARAIDYFFATDPWFAGTPEGKTDDDLADKVDRYSQFKVERSNIKTELTKAIELAFVRGEAVIKTTHVTKENIYRSLASVLVDPSGKFILDTNGDYIFEDDAWVERPEDAVAREQSAASIVGRARAALHAVTTIPTFAAKPPQLYLKKDGMQTPQPDVPIFVENHITRKITLYRGPQAGVVYFGDFLCPLTAPNPQDAAFVAHLYDVPVMSLADHYARRDLFFQKPDDTLDSLKDAVRIAEELGGVATTQPKSAVNQPRRESGETTTDSAAQNPTAQFAECWLTYAAEDDGVLNEIMVVLDLSNKKAMFYDYTANVRWDGKRPFKPVVINQVDGRWHGQGAMEMFCSSQEFIDLLINRLNFRQSGSGRVTFWNPQHTAEGQNNSNLKLNDGATYTLMPSKTAKDCLEYVTLPEVTGADLFNLLQFFMQLTQLESGVVNAGDQNASGLPSSALATGIRNVERSGQEMFGLYLGQLEPGLQAVMDDILGLIFANIDQNEEFQYLEGDVAQLAEITPEEVANMRLNVRLMLTRYRGEQVLQSNSAAAQRVLEFYALAPEVQERVAQFYRQMLKALQVKDADQVIVPIIPPVMMPHGAPGMPAPTGAVAAAPVGQGGAVQAAPAQPAIPQQPVPPPNPQDAAALAAKPPGQQPPNV